MGMAVGLHRVCITLHPFIRIKKTSYLFRMLVDHLTYKSQF